MADQLTVVSLRSFKWFQMRLFAVAEQVGSCSMMRCASVRASPISLSVLGQVGEFQVEGHSALLCSFQIAWPAQFQIGPAILNPSLVSHMISMRFWVSAESFGGVTSMQ